MTSAISIPAAATYSSLLQAIPELVWLERPQSDRSPYLGGLNFTYGCLLAVNKSLQITSDGHLDFQETSYFDGNATIPQVQEAAGYGSLCTNNGSALRIVVPYRWCEDNCSGWEISHWNFLQQWIGPLVQFILPCLAFCLSIPRSWKVSLPQWIFESEPDDIAAFFAYPVKFTIAFTIVFCDTILWLSICFAFAGPMLLSAVYEYILDGMILDFLRPRKHYQQPRIPPVTKARLLLTAVVGNVKLEPRPPNRTPTLPGMRITSNDEIWSHIMGVTDGLVTRPPKRPPVGIESVREASASGGVQSTPDNTLLSTSSSSTSRSIAPETLDNTASLLSRVEPELKLKALLNAQSSFGGAVGAPVVFFIGSFVYNIVEAESRLGDSDTAHALAFGMWWMTISHVAVISSAMLASNNPSALQGLIGKAPTRRRRSTANNKVPASIWAKSVRWMKQIDILEHAYDSSFEPISLWKRGPNKLLWIDKTIEAFAKERDDSNHHIKLVDFQEAFRLGLGMRVGIWASILLVLLGAPCALAFATSYMTPVAGLGCRSLTHLVYYVTQVFQMMLWSWNVSVSRNNPSSWMLRACRVLQGVFGGLAVFAAIGGTIMQIIGVYRNCLCKMPTRYWIHPDADGATVGMSYVTPQSVPNAGVWKTTGALAGGILGLVAALAWWHQRRLRKKFMSEAESLKDLDSEVAIPMTSARPQHPAGAAEGDEQNQ
ncbi:hypothetical protein SCUP234_11404 [Seiridium cupressi]